jgi:hypothetical protein
VRGGSCEARAIDARCVQGGRRKVGRYELEKCELIAAVVDSYAS